MGGTSNNFTWKVTKHSNHWTICICLEHLVGYLLGLFSATVGSERWLPSGQIGMIQVLHQEQILDDTMQGLPWWFGTGDGRKRKSKTVSL